MARLPRSGDDVAVQEAMVSPVEEEGGEDHADLLFLVTTFLSGLPLGREAANVLARDLVREVIPRAGHQRIHHTECLGHEPIFSFFRSKGELLAMPMTGKGTSGVPPLMI
jgi:hypothetical protein